MDIDLLAKMVGELVLDHDEVALPGVGTFVAEFVSASFSDKGFVVNPPYRRLSFRQREGDPSLLVSFYAESNGIDRQRAERTLKDFLDEMRDVLKEKKVIVFPGLGRLRATRENLFFFVPDENLNIYPEGFGLESVSLKRHGPDEEELPAEIVEEVARIAATSESPAATPEPPEAPIDSPEKTTEPPTATPASPAQTPAKPRKKLHPAAKAAIITLAAAVLLLGALAILGRVAPGVADKLLYTPEEREILYQ